MRTYEISYLVLLRRLTIVTPEQWSVAAKFYTPPLSPQVYIMHSERFCLKEGQADKVMESQKLPTFSDAIDAIGMGPFQSRLLLICGMVSSVLCPAVFQLSKIKT